MSVNSYNPRLFSSTSSENDVDEVFRHKGASVVPVGGSLPSAKNRCFSEPVYQNGKEISKKDSKDLGKIPALSDSSNVLRRQRERTASHSGNDNLPGCELKNDCSPVFEELPTGDSIFPEPETNREATKDAYRFSILLEEEEESMDMIPNLGQGQGLGDAGLVGFTDDLDNEGTRAGVVENDVFYMRDVAFGSTIGEHNLEDDIDDSYPEKEYMPSGYLSYTNQDLPYVSCPWDVPRTVLPSYSDLEKMPELPDDLIKETEIYPVEMENEFDCLSSVLLPSTPLEVPDYEMKMKLLFGENS